MGNPLKVAVIPGDGIGKEVMPEGLRALRATAKRFGIEIEFYGIDIHKDGRDAFVAQNVCGGDEGEGGKNNFVAFLEAECANREMKAGSAGGNANSVLRAGVVGDCGFEGFELWA